MNEINNNKVNLCDSCSQVYPDCTSKPENVYFGDGVGHDNICACSEYRPKTCGDGDTISRAAAIAFVDCGYLRPPTELAWSDKDVVDMLKRVPSAQPQLDTCPIYGGMCGYPSNLCYECPRHEGAKERPQWWTEGLQPFAQPQWIPVTERLPERNGRYLVTRGNDAGAFWNRVYIVNYSDLMGLNKEKHWWTGDVGKSNFERILDVLAWMSLPEPWEGEKK